MIAEEVPYGYIDSMIDLSLNIDISNVPISVEVVPHKAYLIDEPINSINSINSSYLNFQIFRLSENRINRHTEIQLTNRRREVNVIQKIKCIFYTFISIPITILLVGCMSTLLNRT